MITTSFINMNMLYNCFYFLLSYCYIRNLEGTQQLSCKNEDCTGNTGLDV